MQEKLQRKPVIIWTPEAINQKLTHERIIDDCGEILPLITADNCPDANLVEVIVRNATKAHFHKKATEFYLIEDGYGVLNLFYSRKSRPELQKEVELKAGTIIMIPPHVWHRIRPYTTLRLKVFSAPAWDRSDVFYEEE